MNVDELARRIVVRHRELGHLRLELPAELCHAATAAVVEGSLRQVEGVYRVDFDLPSRRLSIRFDSHVCTTGDVASQLKALLKRVAPHLPACPPPSSASASSDGEALANHPFHKAGERVREVAREAAARVKVALAGLNPPAVAEGSLQAKLQPVIASALTEKAITNFINDIVAFYLIKVHWELISQRWLKDPLKFRNAWLTTFYLVFLLVRYRKQGAKK